MLSLQVSETQIANLISQLDLDALERIKKAIIKKEAYFKRFKSSPINEIVDDFKKEGYSEELLNDLENGLKKSRIYKK